ncbi:hypothetical protein FOZ76_13145 [Verticiella sediminum]|uniref:Uncharacterized protein n=1 Tax=Verticiella sediminum TaxID=1247510 RepID=A0A556ALT1_9BURK|nr:hypothetical protein [Verticiella sediminum]TSH93831.1 hypothetical protein FOZ76_13145 [Verticiella sediminum]
MSISIPNPIVLKEDGTPVPVGSDITVTSGGSYRGGRITFSIDPLQAGDRFVLRGATGAAAQAVGAISVDGQGCVYVGTGDGVERIGVIDPVEDGLPLTIRFQVPLPNSEFEAGCGVIHGAHIISGVISVQQGDALRLQLRAAGRGGAYEVFGLARRVDGNGNFVGNAIDDDIVLFAERGHGRSVCRTVTADNLPEGEYRLVFVGGTHDGSGRLQVGSKVRIDDVVLLPRNPVDQHLVSAIARHVLYETTANDSAQGRNVRISAVNGSGTLVQGTTEPDCTDINDPQEPTCLRSRPTKDWNAATNPATAGIERSLEADVPEGSGPISDAIPGGGTAGGFGAMASLCGTLSVNTGIGEYTFTPVPVGAPATGEAGLASSTLVVSSGSGETAPVDGGFAGPFTNGTEPRHPETSLDDAGAAALHTPLDDEEPLLDDGSPPDAGRYTVAVHPVPAMAAFEAVAAGNGRTVILTLRATASRRPPCPAFR